MVAVATHEWSCVQLAERAGDELEGASALEILTWADEQFGSRGVSRRRWATRSWRISPSRVRPGVDVLFLDTGYHFAETIGTRDAVAATLPVTVKTITPKRTVAAAGRELRCAAVRAQPGPVLRAAQGAAAARRAGRLHRVGDRAAPRRSSHPSRRTRRRVGRPPQDGEAQPDRDLDAGQGRRLHRRAQRAGQPAAVRRLRLDRVCAVHAPHRRRRGRCAPVAGPARQDRVRHLH